MISLLRTLIRPYRINLFFILCAMLVQTLMSLAAPWPLKIVLDNVVGSHKLPSWLDNVLKPVLAGSSKMQIAAAAAVMVVVIAMLGALASYVANYYTESVGQWGRERSPHADLPPSGASFAGLFR